MTRRKLKIPKLQNTKTKNFQSSQEERKISPLPPCETSHNVFWRPTEWQEEKLKTFKVNKKKCKYPPSPPLWIVTQVFSKTHKMIRRKNEDFGTKK